MKTRSQKCYCQCSTKCDGSYVNHCQPFLKKIRLEEETQERLSLIGAVVMQKAMPVKAGLKTVSAVQEPDI
jgi:hypothetical protein